MNTPRHHVQVTALASGELPNARAKTIALGEQPGERHDIPRDPGGAMLHRARLAAGVSVRQLAPAAGLGVSTIAERCQCGGLDMAELDRLVESPAGRRVLRQVIELYEARLAACESGPAPNPERGALIVQREAGQLADAVINALLNDGCIDAAEQRTIDKEAADVQIAARRLRGAG